MSEGPEVSVTAKAGTGYDAPWVVVRGQADEVQAVMQQIIDGGMLPLVAQMSRGLAGCWTVTKNGKGGLNATYDENATVADRKSRDSKPAVKPAAPAAGLAPVAAAEPSAHDRVLAEIGGATSREALRIVGKSNRAIIGGDWTLKDAYRARHAQLSQ